MGHFRRTAPKHSDSHGDGVNARIAVAVTNGVGTMACAYCFAAIALISLPAAIASGSVIVIVSWVAQTFFQLVLLSVIMVGQRVQSRATDAQTEHISLGVDTILERLEQSERAGAARRRAAKPPAKRPAKRS